MAKGRGDPTRTGTGSFENLARHKEAPSLLTATQCGLPCLPARGPETPCSLEPSPERAKATMHNGTGQTAPCESEGRKPAAQNSLNAGSHRLKHQQLRRAEVGPIEGVSKKQTYARPALRLVSRLTLGIRPGSGPVAGSELQEQFEVSLKMHLGSEPSACQHVDLKGMHPDFDRNLPSDCFPCSAQLQQGAAAFKLWNSGLIFHWPGRPF